MKELDLPEDAVLQDIKSDPVTEQQVDEMRQGVDSYETLFSKRAMKFRAMGLHEQQLTENDYRRLITEEYTFLRRPVLVKDGVVIPGNSAKAVEAMKNALAN